MRCPCGDADFGAKGDGESLCARFHRASPGALPLCGEGCALCHIPWVLLGKVQVPPRRTPMRGPPSLIDAHEVPWVLESLSETWNAPWIPITDSALRPSVLKALSECRLEIKWFGFARFYRILQDKNIAKGLLESGCRMLQVGLQSASPRILGMLKRASHWMWQKSPSKSPFSGHRNLHLLDLRSAGGDPTGP